MISPSHPKLGFPSSISPCPWRPQWPSRFVPMIISERTQVKINVLSERLPLIGPLDPTQTERKWKRRGWESESEWNTGHRRSTQVMMSPIMCLKWTNHKPISSNSQLSQLTKMWLRSSAVVLEMSKNDSRGCVFSWQHGVCVCVCVVEHVHTHVSLPSTDYKRFRCRISPLVIYRGH